MSDSPFVTREARREGAKVVIALAGTSGSGKTYTAIILAYGLAGYDASKVGFLDTENKRGSLYSDILPDGKKFKIVDSSSVGWKISNARSVGFASVILRSSRLGILSMNPSF